MHEGHPCKDLYSEDFFQDGITNGAQWYSVPGEPTLLHSLSLYFYQCIFYKWSKQVKLETKTASFQMLLLGKLIYFVIVERGEAIFKTTSYRQEHFLQTSCSQSKQITRTTAMVMRT